MIHRHTTNLLLTGSLLAFCFVPSVLASPIDEAIATYQSAMQCTDRFERISGFNRAELLFRKAIEDSNGTANAELYANLGTVCLSAERIGPAVLAYHKALLIEPTHEKAEKNLAYARKLLPEWARRSVDTNLYQQVSSPASKRILSMLAAACFLIASVLLAGRIRWRSSFLSLLALFPLAAWLAILTFVHSTTTSMPDGVIIREDVVARSADSNNASMRFTDPLPSGTEVAILDERDDWLQISLRDQTAWVPKSAVATVSLP